MITLENITLTGSLKTYDGWEGDLGDYLQPGDEADSALADYFRDVLPPACFNGFLTQIGEPQDHEGPNNRPRFSTLQRHGNTWIYTGYRPVGSGAKIFEAGDHQTVTRYAITHIGDAGVRVLTLSGRHVFDTEALATSAIPVWNTSNGLQKVLTAAQLETLEVRRVECWANTLDPTQTVFADRPRL